MPTVSVLVGMVPVLQFCVLNQSPVPLSPTQVMVGVGAVVVLAVVVGLWAVGMRVRTA
jgi:hypothetical protein